MKNKGFTLVELIVVIVLITLVSIVVAVNMTGIQQNNNEIEMKRFKDRISDTACQYIDKGSDLLLSTSNTCAINSRLTTRDDCKENSDGCYICLDTLIEEGLVDKEEVNPINNKKLKEEGTSIRIKVKWVNDNGSKRKECSYVGEDDVIDNINVETRKRTLYFNYGEGTGNETSRQIEENHAFGSLPTGTWSGHAIDYWYYTLDNTRHASPTDVMGTSDISLTAHWIVSQKTITYHNENGSGCSTGTGNYGSQWGTLCTPTRSGFAFSGWYTQPNGAGSQVTSTTTVENNIDVYAKWTQVNYTLTYQNDGGSGCSTKTGVYDSSWGTLCTPSRSGYNFDGWYTGRSGTGTQITSSTTVSGDLTVYAKWKVYDLYVYNNGVVSGYQPTSITYSGSTPPITYTPSTISYNAYMNSALYISTQIPNNYHYLNVHVLYTARNADWAQLRLGVRPRTGSDGSSDYSQWFIPVDWYAVSIPNPSSSWQTVKVDLSSVSQNYYFYMHTAGTTITIDKIWFSD